MNKNKYEEWDVCMAHPEWKRNFVCHLTPTGLWRLENPPTWGKWLFLIEPLNQNNTTPTYADVRNFMSGILEAEKRNDNFEFTSGSDRQPQCGKKVKMFRELIEKYTQEENKLLSEPKETKEKQTLKLYIDNFNVEATIRGKYEANKGV